MPQDTELQGGWMGKLLHVDVEDESAEVVEPDPAVYEKYIGGYGLAAWYIYNNQPAGVDPLSPENILGFMTGPLTNTKAFTSGRFMVCGKSPLTGTWGDSNCGGTFALGLKKTGFDGIFVTGKTPEPSYLLVDDGDVEVRDATEFWGMDTYDAEEAIEADAGGNVDVAVIGPAGERESLISGIFNDRGRTAARSGVGAMMGSKNLKGVAVRGSHKTPVADPETEQELLEEYMDEREGDVYELFHNLGTQGAYENLVMLGDSPIKNWREAGLDNFPDAGNLSGEEYLEYEERKYACARCQIACGGILEIDGGKYDTDGETHKPEYETVAALGGNIKNDDIESVIRSGDLCNRYGFDSISAGAVIAFAMECYERGILDESDLDGVDPEWGDPDVPIELLGMMADREGIGDVLADGVQRAAAEIGDGAEEYAFHVHGQEVSYHDPRYAPGFATIYTMSPTPGRHTQGGSGYPEFHFPVRGFGEEVDWEKHDYGDEVKAERHREYMAFLNVNNSAGICQFTPQSVPGRILPDYLEAITGLDYDMDRVVRDGERIEHLRHLFNLREGINPIEDFEIPGRVVGDPPLEEGPTADVTVDVETQNRKYREEMTWDDETALPSRDRLESLGMDEFVDDLADLGGGAAAD